MEQTVQRSKQRAHHYIHVDGLNEIVFSGQLLLSGTFFMLMDAGQGLSAWLFMLSMIIWIAISYQGLALDPRTDHLSPYRLGEFTQSPSSPAGPISYHAGDGLGRHRAHIAFCPRPCFAKMDATAYRRVFGIGLISLRPRANKVLGLGWVISIIGHRHYFTARSELDV